MYDLHTHTFFSDGVLGPAELVQRYSVAGYDGVVIADHADLSTIDLFVPKLVNFCNGVNKYLNDIFVVPGCEITHVLPEMISESVSLARNAGAKLVVVHGETIVEPVKEGTNHAAILAGCDVLAHPGLISEEDVVLAKDNGVCLEITARRGHSLTNAHVAKLALKYGARLVYSSDFHAPGDLNSCKMVELILYGAGLSKDQVLEVLKNTKEVFQSKL